MGFYGKIYEEMRDVFNRVSFKNAPQDTNIFNSEELKDFTLDAESHGDDLPFIAGNSWIEFVEGDDGKGNAICKIYHSKPQGKDVSKTLPIIHIEAGQEYWDLIESDLLTEEEKQELQNARNQNNFIYFGDTIYVEEPEVDAAGHIIKYDQKAYVIGTVPRMEDILNVSNEIAELQRTVGVAGYETEETSLIVRVSALEADFEDVRATAVAAEELANSASESATAAETAAEKAQAAAEKAQASAEKSSNNLTTYQKNTNDRFDTIQADYVDLTAAVGFTNNDSLSNQLGYTSLYAWAKYADSELDIINGIIGDEDSSIRDGTSPTLVEQIHSNDDDISQLQKDLATEITNRQAADAELEALINSSASDLSGEIDNAVADLQSLISSEEAARIAADNTLSQSISTEASNRAAAISSLQTSIDGITTSLNNEVSRATGAEQDLGNRLTSLDTRLTTAKGNIQTNVNNINANAAAIAKLNGNATVEGSIANLIAIETTARQNADTDLSNQLSSLLTLVETLQSNITELQNKVAVLESYHAASGEETTPPEEETPTE